MNQAASGQNDGSVWVDAFVDLQDALSVAQASDEIWVAGGTYTPDRGTADRSMSFELVGGVGLYGGFAGTETCRDEWNRVANETILSGDLNGDDGPRDCAEFSDCCRAHDTPGCDNPACEAIVCNAGIKASCCDPLPFGRGWDENCAHFASTECCDIGNWRACENTFNVVKAFGVAPGTVLDGFTVERAYGPSVRDGYNIRGGGVYFYDEGLTVRNCTFRDNMAWGLFGGSTSSHFEVDHCVFLNNLAQGMVAEAQPLTVTNTEFRDNGYGGLRAYGSAYLRNCLFQGNSPYSALEFEGDLILEDSLFRDNYGAITYRHGRALIRRCHFTNNTPWVGGIAFDGSLATVSDSVFYANSQPVIGAFSSSVDVINCAFIANRPRQLEYPTLDAAWSAIMKVTNCTFAGARADNCCGFAPPVIRAESSSSAEVTNSILWAHDDAVIQPYYELIRSYFGATVSVNHSIVQGWDGALGGVGNSGDDPMFVDPIGPDGVPGTEDDDLRLMPGSPAINAGDPDSTGLTATDLDGHARVLCGRVDIGAYEFGIGDFNCDQIIDLSDFANWSTCMTGPGATSILPGCEPFDFNADHSIDLRDFYLLTHVFVTP